MTRKLGSICYVCHNIHLTACFFVLQDTNERRRAAALLGLPLYITGEDPSNVIRMCDVRIFLLKKNI